MQSDAVRCPRCWKRLRESQLTHEINTGCGREVATKTKAAGPTRGRVARADYLASVQAAHGTRKRFEKGCRCEQCDTGGREAHNAYHRAWRARRAS